MTERLLPVEDIRRRKGKIKGWGCEIRVGDEPCETMGSRKQMEGFRGEGVEGWVSLVVGLRRARITHIEHWVWCINN